MEKTERVAELGKIFCSVSVQASLDEAGITRAELLQLHQQHHDGEAALEKADWKCSPFAMPCSGQTLWVMTDPQEQATMLLLEEP